jgi:hypothetical protein
VCTAQTCPERKPNPGVPAASSIVASEPVRPRRPSRRWVPTTKGCRWGERSRR